MNTRTHLRLIITAAVCLAVTTVFAQNPPAAPARRPAPQRRSKDAARAPPGQIPIPQACTPEQIAAAQAAASQPADAAAGRGRGGGRGGGVNCHMPDKREGLKAGKYNAGEAALNMKLVASHAPARGHVRSECHERAQPRLTRTPTSPSA